ncbi:MAG: polysaccharide biosynthesis/export family protein [candidate division WOR-3 bacterium]
MIGIWLSYIDTVGVGDVLSISVYGREEYADVKVIVPPSCNAYFPLVGRLKVCGLTLDKLSDTLQKLLKPYYDLPVIVFFQEIAPPTVVVLGEVVNPGSVRYIKGMRLADALSQAGIKPTSDVSNIKINGKSVDLTRENPMLYPGDRVEVPSKWWKGFMDGFGLLLNTATFGILFYTTFIKK